MTGQGMFDFSGMSHNAYYRIYRGRYVISPAGRAFRERVRRTLAHLKKKPTKDKLRLRIRFYFKDKRRRDLDNYQKALIDALKGVVFEDDSQIFQLHTSKVIGHSVNKMVVFWRTIPP